LEKCEVDFKVRKIGGNNENLILVSDERGLN
jgi:hypothetical protein